nr:putative nucleotidyltransferase substrate binding domain-containing protein [Evansella tamaricis]
MTGEETLLHDLKKEVFQKLRENPHLYYRLYENVGKIPKATGVFGQFLPEQYGSNAGKINLKQAIFFPYVNSLRLLAYVEEIYSSSTIDRFDQLPSRYEEIKKYKEDFIRLLHLRVIFQQNAADYEGVHYLELKILTGSDKQELKNIARHGRDLFMKTKAIIENRCHQ